jgi:two-component sensor histidine kinase
MSLATDGEDGIFIREAHHRIANSLQIASSFLRLRARSASDAEVRREFAGMAARLTAVGLLHRRLCGSDKDEDLVSLSEYIQELCSELGASTIGASGAEFRFDANTNEAVRLRSRTATLVGIILTELLTNCVKHGGEKPVCTIEMSKHDDLVSITVSDDGPGLRADRLSAAGGTGLDVVRDLVSRLKATIGILPSARGARLVLTVPTKLDMPGRATTESAARGGKAAAAAERRQRTEDKLDDALQATFPASDAVAICD